MVQVHLFLNILRSNIFLHESWFWTDICPFKCYLEAFVLCGIKISCLIALFLLKYLAFIVLISNNLCKLLCSNLGMFKPWLLYAISFILNILLWCIVISVFSQFYAMSLLFASTQNLLLGNKRKVKSLLTLFIPHLLPRFWIWIRDRELWI